MWILGYGSFRFFLGGDIAGDGGPAGGNHGNNDKATALLAGDSKKSFTAHADIESPVTGALSQFFAGKIHSWAPLPGQPKFPHPGYATVMKANHHGSKTSNDVYLLASVRPRLFLISSGFRTRFHHHPTQHVNNRTSSHVTPEWQDPSGRLVRNSIEQVYVTECADIVETKTGGNPVPGLFHDVEAVMDKDEHGQPVQGLDRACTATRVSVRPGPSDPTPYSTVIPTSDWRRGVYSVRMRARAPQAASRYTPAVAVSIL